MVGGFWLSIIDFDAVSVVGLRGYFYWGIRCNIEKSERNIPVLESL